MLGNDVVDLADPEVRPGSTHPRFDRRVFGPAERSALRASGAPNRLRWILWAAKEAAYKAARRLDPAAVFSPRRFVVSLDARLRGHVEHEDLRFALRVQEGASRVHALAAAPGLALGAVRAGVVRLAAAPSPADASAAARDEARRAAAALLGEGEGVLQVVGRGRLPVLLRRGEPVALALSLSHHGRYAAFALAPGPGAGAT